MILNFYPQEIINHINKCPVTMFAVNRIAKVKNRIIRPIVLTITTDDIRINDHFLSYKMRLK